ncbi:MULTISPECIES: amidase [unclassified Devosia]|uniref:amidase n=1 Tax=unclassified Devosia TaxID=196773 RepID=UPI001552A84F|nr:MULTISPECIES: amidase [unclassified Devosia]
MAPDATALSAELATGRISAVELVEQSIAAIEAGDGVLNAVVVRDFERARAAAGEADRRLAAGEQLPLLGVPITIKESFDVEGLPTSWGLEAFRGAVAREDAVAVARLRAAGAVILGKTNVSEGLDGWNAENPVYGRTGNPVGAGLSPGGSSSGAAAAVAAGYVPLDIGSDLGGSIRGPAQFCGIWGHVASMGLIPLRGHALAGRKARFDLSCPGPLARSARDLELGLTVMAGPDADEAVGYTLTLPPPRVEKLSELRVLVLEEHPMVPTDPEVRAGVALAAELLGRAGAKVRRAEGVMPDVEEATRIYLRLLGGAVALGQTAEQLAAAREELLGLDPGSMAAWRIGGMVASHAEWIEANEARVKLRWAWQEVFRDWDALICPPMSVAALGEAEAAAPSVLVDGVAMERGDSVAWTALGNGAALPATVMPIGRMRDGRPTGIQIIGPYLEDRTTISIAGLLAAAQCR